ncbi:ABC transporter substrate-binding protein [Lachnospiraceae bacterium OttesenSCG-928-D06]|nr:ABC transporter substrate-binding protein [Lachnospiraceae bacterium OttesenSCG-928-D06]
MSKKKMVSLLMTGFMLVSTITGFTGCGNAANNTNSGTGNETEAVNSSKETNKDNASDTSSEKITITYWHIFPEGDVFKPVHDELIQRFNESQDEIYVEDLGISFFDFLSKMDTAIPAGTGPDVAFYDLGESQRRAAAGVLVDLTPYIEAENFDIGQYYSWAADIGTYEDKWYALPFAGGGRIMVYNKEMFREAGLDPEAPPTTLEELEEYADKLTKISDNGDIEVLGFHPSLGNVSYRDYVIGRGSDFFAEDGTPIINSDTNLEALEWYTRMTNKYGAKQVQSLQAASKTTGIDPFLAGYVAMEINVADFYKKLSESDIDYGICAVPVSENGGVRGTQGGSFDLEIFDHNDQARADAAWEFIKYMTNVESQQYWASENKWPSTNQKAMESYEAFQDDPNWQVIIEELPYAKALKFQSQAPNWWGLLNPEIESAQLEQKTPKDALDAGQEAIAVDIENNLSMN